MKPVVIVDTNALHGLRSFSSVDFKTVLALAATGYVRLVVPDVVVHELARQAAKELADSRSKLRSAAIGFNSVAGEVAAIGVTVALPATEVGALPLVDRENFHRALVTFLQNRSVETPIFPDVSVVDLLTRDLDSRKPFAESGKGFRDALIWATIRELCNDLKVPDELVVFVTKNHTDFCLGKEKGLHDHLRHEISPDQRFDVVEDLPALLRHSEIAYLVSSLRVVDESFTPATVAKLVDNALSDLWGHDLAATVGEYGGDGFYEIPIATALTDTAFDDIAPDDNTITSQIFTGSDEGEMTIRVTVDADCSIEGFIDKGELLARESDAFSYVEDWNRHMFRASESHRLRFTLSGDFTEETIDDVSLAVDGVEEVM